MSIGECMEYAQKLCDAKSSAERIDARKELRAAIAATVKAETDRLTRELAEARARAGSATASLPDGWVAVPVEPTGGMVDSGFFALLEAETDDNGALMFSAAEVIYRAMLSARPEFPKESEHE